MLPIELILVRHGQSEGNVADKASGKGDNRFFTPAFRERHSRSFRLTDLGIQQAKAAGQWLRDNVPMPLDRFYVSDYIRARETAAYLGLPGAKWEAKFQLRERDKGLMDNCPADEQRRLFKLTERQHRLDRFLVYPAGGGESFPLLCLRLKTYILTHLEKEYPDMDQRVIIVCHGDVIRAFQMELEDLGHDDFIRLDSSSDPADRILTCQILWYSRRYHDNPLEISPEFVAVRSVCAHGLTGDYGWRPINRSTQTNEQLLEEVSTYPRHIR